MKTEIQVRGMLKSHTATMAQYMMFPSELTQVAKKMGENVDFVRGYLEGVKDAYELILADNQIKEMKK